MATNADDQENQAFLFFSNKIFFNIGLGEHSDSLFKYNHIRLV